MNLYTNLVKLSGVAGRRLGVTVQRQRPVRDATRHLLYKMEEFGVEALLDVGANKGQFARGARALGFRGDIYSFEPLSVAHAICTAAAQTDPRWTVVPPMALGARSATAMINVAENLASSSLLDVEARSVDAVSASGYKGTEEILVRTLDEVVELGWSRPFGLKIDTQGFEMEVLRGARETLADVPVILLEMSLTPLYKGAPRFGELFDALEGLGYRCVGLTQGFADHRRHELLQADGLFIRER